MKPERRINTCPQYVRPRRERLDRPDGDDEDREVDILDDGAGPGAQLGRAIVQKLFSHFICIFFKFTSLFIVNHSG